MIRLPPAAPAALLLLLTIACGPPRPVALVLGEDVCDQCHMTVADPRFAAELLTRQGKVFRFDDVGCLAEFVATGRVPGGDVHSLWVADYLEAGAFLSVEEARFLVSEGLRTPMNHAVVALRAGPPADSLRSALGGDLAAWDDVVAAARGHAR